MGDQLVHELGLIPFENILSSPLNTIISAQAKSTQVMLKFIKRYAFEGSEKQTDEEEDEDDEKKKKSFADSVTPKGKPRMMVFNVQRGGGLGGMPMMTSISVPMLCMMPIPVIKVMEMHVTFNCKLTATEYSNTERQNTNFSSIEYKSRRSKWSAMYADTRTDKDGNKIAREYSLKVEVKMKQDDLPGGMGRVLDLLETSIKEEVAPANLFGQMGFGGAQGFGSDASAFGGAGGAQPAAIGGGQQAAPATQAADTAK